MRYPVAALLAGAFLLAFASFARAQTAGGPDVVIHTSLGDIRVALDPARAPKTVDNFLRYVNEGHYDGTIVYRVVPGFVIQAGSYDSATNTRPVHEPIPLEAGNGLANVRGAIAMARQTEPDSATAEFFIDLADNAALDRQPDDAEGTTGYAVFGHVVSGMDVVDKIAAVPLAPGGPMPGAFPAQPVTIEKISVVSAAPPNLPDSPPPPPPIPSDSFPPPR
jgi:cyclophilin family peptidyl-prolyl cis-trans isomerase